MNVFCCVVEKQSLFVFLSVMELLIGVPILMGSYLYTLEDPSKQWLKKLVFYGSILGISITGTWLAAFASSCSLQSRFHFFMASLRFLFVCAGWSTGLGILLFLLYPNTGDTGGVVAFAIMAVLLAIYGCFGYAHFLLLRGFFKQRSRASDFMIGSEGALMDQEEW